MHYHNRVFGSIDITEPVLLELIESPAIQRLKGIDQAGYRPLWVKPDADIASEEFSRYSHSLGVCMLLRQYDAPLEEQIAGLLHDVSHSAFSHCVDYALEHGSGATQEHQDEYFLDYVQQTEIPDTLTKYGYDPAYIFDQKNFPLLEQPLPDVCADRLDYVLRNAEAFLRSWDTNHIQELLGNLSVQDNHWVFRTVSAAREFAELFKYLNDNYFASFLGAVMLQTVGDYLGYALQKKYIRFSDLYTTDQEVLAKLQPRHATDQTLNKLYRRMNDRTHVVNNPGDYDRVAVCKSRIVDPRCIVDGKTARLSDVQPEWKSVVQEELQPKTYYLKFT